MTPKIYSFSELHVRRIISTLFTITLLFGAALLFAVPKSFASSNPSSNHPSSNHLSSNDPDKLVAEISQTHYWKKLLHYKSNLLLPGYRSDITDPAFFLSENGWKNPEQELLATITAFKNDPSAICRFPARYHWLSSKFGGTLFDDTLEIATGKLTQCSELQEWNETINPGSATLIFPAAYLNGPSSMFGHTLLRIEPADERADLPLLTYAVNYAANVSQADNDMAFAFKGILGGYPGVMAIVPYHTKIKEYGEIENRDIWEYRLNLDKSEIAQMLRHAWELKDLRSAYYFFDLNCSYLILNLIETAREDIDLTNQFRFKVIPIDTVRAVVSAGLVADTQYRAAATTQLAQRYKTLKPGQRAMVKQILDNQPDLVELRQIQQSPADFARVLEIVYDTNRYRAFQTPAERDDNAKYNLLLLTERSQQAVKDIWPQTMVPDFKPEHGHKSARFAIGYGKQIHNQESQDELMLKIRPAYHDLLDSAQGFPVGAQINFLDFSLSYNNENHDMDLDGVTIIDILSLTPSHDLFESISWRVDFSYEKNSISNDDINILQVSPGFGKSGYFAKHFLGYGLVNGIVEYSPDFEDDFAVGSGVQIGALLTDNLYSGLIEFKSSRLFLGQTDTRFSAMLGVARHISADLSLRLTAEREKLFSQYINYYQFNVNWYF